METKIIISKFWTRVWALLIDSIVLGIIGYLLGLTIQDFLISVGSYGFIFGLIITVAYQTICNSNLLNGQTIGKYFMKIQVVDINGDTINLGKSFLRALILSLPYFTFNLSIPGFSDTSFISIVKTFILLSIVIGVVVIYIFNRQTRQSLHDLIVGTYVVTTKENEVPVTIPTVTKTPFYVFGGLVTLLVCLAVCFMNSETPEQKNVLSIYHQVSQIDGVLSVNVGENTIYSNGSKTLSYETKLQVKILPDDELENDKMVRKTVQTILNNVTDINNFDVIVISLNRGFNIGIASQNSTKRVSYSPVKWREILKQKI
jgi:uncharacterized RDD family membrane protein YckC